MSELILDLTPRHALVAANGDGDSAASTVTTDRKKADAPLLLSPAGGGNVRTSHSLTTRKLKRKTPPGEAAIISDARPVMVKEILALLGNDVPSPRLHANYLERLSFAALCSRRDQLVAEKLAQLKREEREAQPELFPTRNSELGTRNPVYDRSTKYFGAVTGANGGGKL